MTADPSTHPPTEAVGEVRRRVEEDWTTNVELENAVAEVKRAQGVETMQAYQLAKLLPEHLRQPFWEDAVKYYLADALALTEAVERDGCWVPLAEATKLRSDLAAMTSDRDWLRTEFEKASAGSAGVRTLCRGWIQRYQRNNATAGEYAEAGRLILHELDGTIWCDTYRCPGHERDDDQATRCYPTTRETT